MTGRERVQTAMHGRPADKIPVQFYYSPVGYYEHGEKLNELYATLPGDFGPYVRIPPAGPAKEDLDAEGRYHAFRRDEWGTLWEYRIFGVTGIPAAYPLADITRLDQYVMPPVPPRSGLEFDAFCTKMAIHRQQYYDMQSVGSFFERLIELRPEADVLCDIALNEPEINRLADKIIAYDSALVDLAIASGADGISFGDDYGMEQGLIMDPVLWRSFIKPRLKALFAPAVKNKLDIHFHSCGQISQILGDLREIGVTSIWPQLPAYVMEKLAGQCRDLGLAIAIHTDRARTMTYGAPQDVHDLVMREYEVFRMAEGGSWFYIEADNGFPYANLEALIETIRQCR